MDRAIITMTPANVISIGVAGLLGYWILVGAVKAYKAMTGQAVGG